MSAFTEMTVVQRSKISPLELPLVQAQVEAATGPLWDRQVSGLGQPETDVPDTTTF